MKKYKWTRNTGKPYIRRANGKERAGTFRDAYRLAYMREKFGPCGFYVMMQRKTDNAIMECGRTRRNIKERIAVVAFGHRTFAEWAAMMKRHAQGRA